MLKILMCLTLSYAIAVSSNLIYDFSPLSNPFAGLTNNEWWFSTQPGPIITNSTIKLDSIPGLGSTALVLGSTKSGTVIQFRGERLMDFGTPTVAYGPYGCGYIAISGLMIVVMSWVCVLRGVNFFYSTYLQHKCFILYVPVSSRAARRPYYDVPWRLELVPILCSFWLWALCHRFLSLAQIHCHIHLRVLYRSRWDVTMLTGLRCQPWPPLLLKVKYELRVYHPVFFGIGYLIYADFEIGFRFSWHNQILNLTAWISAPT